MNGRIHSFQSLGAVDGPGVRVTVFMQGCPLRCAYCHNPDTWVVGAGEQADVDSVFSKIMRYRTYFKQKGGVTLSGGEPLLQADFALELFKKLKKEGVHTAIDTSGVCDLEKAKQVLEYTDLVMCDIKFGADEDYKKYTGASLYSVLKFLQLCQDSGVTLWVRHVVVPTLTDSLLGVERIVSLATQYSVLEKIELLPFKKLCLSKYNKLNIRFPLENVEECSKETIDLLKKVIPVKFQ